MKRGRSGGDYGSAAGYGKYKRARTGGGDVFVPEAMVIGAQQARVAAPLARPRPVETKYNDVGTGSGGDSKITIQSVAAQATWAGCEIDPFNAAVGAQLCIGLVPPGTGYFQRIGRRIRVRKLRIRGEIEVPLQANQTAADQAGLVRIVLYQDKQTGGVQAQAEEVLGASESMDVQNDGQAIHVPQNPINFGRFRVLYDKTFKLTPPPISYDGTNVEQAGFSVPFKINVKCDVPINFNQTNGSTVADIVDNSFHVIAATTSGLNCSLSYVCRMVFEDA